MSYVIPDLPEEDQKAIGKVIFSPDFDKHEIKSFDLPSGKVLKVTYTTTRSGFEVVDKENWVDGSLCHLSTDDKEYLLNALLFESHSSDSGEFKLPSGIRVRISPGD